MPMSIGLISIGIVSNEVTARVDENWRSVVSRINVNPELKNGLRGLDAFSHVIIITHLHEAAFDARRDLVRRPRGLPTMPEVGIFAQRAKDRPNPIGITAVRIVKVGEDYVEVEGLDAIDGTPVLDIKPYYPQYDLVGDARVPEWVNRLMENYF